jgi:hypothetical protein
MEAYEEVELTAPLIHSLGITYSWSASRLWCFTLRERTPPVPIEHEAGWVPEQFWMLQGREKSLVCAVSGMTTPQLFSL